MQRFKAEHELITRRSERAANVGQGFAEGYGGVPTHSQAARWLRISHIPVTPKTISAFLHGTK